MTGFHVTSLEIGATAFWLACLAAWVSILLIDRRDRQHLAEVVAEEQAARAALPLRTPGAAAYAVEHPGPEGAGLLEPSAKDVEDVLTAAIRLIREHEATR